MRARFFAALTVASVLSVYGVVRADDTKKDAKPDAKKDDPKKDDCDGCCDDDGKSGCADCDKAKEGCCKGCADKIESGAAFVLPVKGMMCSACETKVADAIKGVDGVAMSLACTKKNAAILAVAPGKSVKLSAIETAIAKTKGFSLDETAAMKGQLTLTVENVTDKDALCGIVCKLLGIDCKSSKDCPVAKFEVDEKTKTAQVPVTLGIKTDVSLKKIKDVLADAKLKLGDVTFHGPKDDAKKS